MPITIPYDPSLALGNLVIVERLQNFEAMATAQAPADGKQRPEGPRSGIKTSAEALPRHFRPAAPSG